MKAPDRIHYNNIEYIRKDSVPSWTKTNVHGTSIGEIDGMPALFHNGYYIKIQDLEKLQKED